MTDCRSAPDLARLSAIKTYRVQGPRPAPTNSPNGDGLAERGAPDEFERAQRVARGEIDPIDLQWLSKGFAAFLTGCGAIPLERCLRLPRNDSALRRACRNFWLRRAWGAIGKQLSPWCRSEKLAAAVRDFESRHWQRWRTLEQPPADGSELDVALFQAFRSHARIPFTAMQIHNIASSAGE